MNTKALSPAAISNRKKREQDRQIFGIARVDVPLPEWAREALFQRASLKPTGSPESIGATAAKMILAMLDAEKTEAKNGKAA